jgi:hypothetical protein
MRFRVPARFRVRDKTFRAPHRFHKTVRIGLQLAPLNRGTSSPPYSDKIPARVLAPRQRGDFSDMRIALTALSFFVVFILALTVSPKNFGSEAIPLSHWRNTPLTGIEYLEDTESAYLEESAYTEDIDTLSSDATPTIVDEAALRLPEGPPPPPPEIGTEALCHTLASAAQANGLPTGFFARLIWQESKFQQRVVSHAGAQGVAQFMPAVAAERGLDNPFDALSALSHSARFLKEHVKFFGNLGLAAAAYNAGTRRVTEWLARRGPLPAETRNYVKVITGHAPEKWIEPQQIDLPTGLPQRAPCDGVADLARDAEPAKIAVQIEPPVAKLIEKAKIEIAARARAAAAKAKRLAERNRKSKREQLLARGKGGQDKLGQDKPGKDKPGKANIKVADTAGTKR